MVRVTVAAVLLLSALPAVADEAIVPGAGYVVSHDDPERDSAIVGAAGSRLGPRPDAERPLAPDVSTEGAGATDGRSRSAGADAIREACRREIDAYLGELLAMLGIDDIEHPMALIQGLEASGAFGAAPTAWPGIVPSLGVAWPVDPIQPLAWNFELRVRAKELTECVRRAD